MKKILANNIKGEQMIFESYKEISDYFHKPQNAIKAAVDDGEPIPTDKGVWFFDELEE